jgi:pimeloyl-ACP methyl ester carboxylesterase
VLLVPAFVRPAVDWQIYTHALDRDALITPRPDLKRLDLQLLAMVERTRGVFAAEGIATDERILLQGFSASGMFANRFTALHPRRVKAVAAGSPGGWPIAPLARAGELALDYPAGIGDIEVLTGEPFDLEGFRAVPQLLVLGSLDENDSLDFGDGWDQPQADALQKTFGATPLERWDDAERLYDEAGANARFLLVEGIGHDRRKLQSHTTEFFRDILSRRDR